MHFSLAKSATSQPIDSAYPLSIYDLASRVILIDRLHFVLLSASQSYDPCPVSIGVENMTASPLTEICRLAIWSKPAPMEAEPAGDVFAKQPPEMERHAQGRARRIAGSVGHSLISPSLLYQASVILRTSGGVLSFHSSERDALATTRIWLAPDFFI